MKFVKGFSQLPPRFGFGDLPSDAGAPGADVHGGMSQPPDISNLPPEYQGERLCPGCYDKKEKETNVN